MVDITISYNDPRDYVMPYFQAKEIACKHCGLIRVTYSFLVELPKLREAWGALSLISCCRCPEHNKGIGGHENSLHQTENKKHEVATCAIDINVHTYTPDAKRNLVKVLDALDWSTGLKENTIHADRRTDIGLPKTRFFYNSHIPSWYRGQGV